jgi:hypothetical protein
MLKIKKFLGSKSGIFVLSVVLGLGLSCVFKMSCDSRSCMVYKPPDYSEKKIIKYNNKCYTPTEHMETCDTNKEIISL